MSASISTGEDLREFETEHLGFRALSQGSEGPKKLKILPEPWPSEKLPPSCATLLSVASNPGLLAAAGPDALVVTSTEKVRKAFHEKAGEGDVITDFTPDVTIPLGSSPLRHVIFSSAGDFLIISAENKGGLAIFSTEDLLAGKKEPQTQIPTDDVAVRALLPNPSADLEHYMAAVLESGKLCLVDVANNNQTTLQDRGVSCVTWSTKGKAVAAGLQDGSVVIQMTDGTIKGTIPRPEGVEENYEVTGIVWIKNTELLVAHGPRASPTADEEENKYHIVKCNKTWTEFEFHSTPWDPLPSALQPPPRAAPSRFSAIRLSGWEPELDDMLIITTSQTDTITILTSSSKPLAAGQTQADCGQWVIANPEDSKKASVPRMVYGQDGDSLLIGEALDLSATEKVLRPIPSLEEISEAPWPLPAYMALTHQGVLMVWWVVWNRSIEKGTRYPGLIAGSDATQPKAAFTQKDVPASPAPNSFGQSSTPINRPASQASPFGKPAATFGSPSIPSFGAPGLGSTPPFIAKPAQPAFGASGFGSTTPATTKPAQPAFGSAGFGSAAKPAAPAFGSPSAMGGAQTTSGFGAVGAMGSKSSPWAASSSTQANPFSSASGTSSGFAKFGQTGGTSSFSSFGSNNGSQSGFGTFGQTQQKSALPGLKTEPSTGSTITINSGTGSTLPSWANTPAQQGSGLFSGQSKFSSFNTSSFESKTSEISDTENRKRDEATPTPQPPPQAAKGLFGLAGGFKLGTTFTADGTAKDDPAKPAAPSTGSFFGSDFTSGLGGNNLKAPITPAKDTGKDDPQDMSTTPTSPPKQQELGKPDQAPTQESATPRAPLPAEEKPAPVDDAPLPPDFLTTKPTKSVDDDLPPLAGSPGVQVEAPSSSVEASPIDEEDGFSVEEEEEDDEQPVEPSPSDTQRKPQPAKPSGFSFQDSVNQSPAAFPPAPTPPVARPSNTTQPSLFGNSSRPVPTQPLFGQAQQQQQPALFASTQSKAPAQPYFAPPVNRAQDSLRSPSPVRSASTSALRTRRDPITTSGTPLSASIQIAKPPTPQPAVTLEDEEDERMRAQLASAIQPSRTLEEFVAYQNYSGNKSPTKTGTAAQIELIYRDINGMIDMLGWNARSIKSFTEYHKQPQSGHKVDRETLEDINDEGEDGSWFESWTIGEIEGLKAVVDDLEDELEAGRVQDVIDKLQQLNRLLREKAKCMTRVNDIRRQIINRQDPERVAASRKAPLSKEAAELQKNLRIEYARLLTSLGQAEEASVVLRSRLASHNAQQGKAGAVPTVDAVKKTIIKMTSLAEKRNNDITLIESQMRKLGLVEPSRPSSSSSRTMGTPRRSRGTSLRNSTADSPFATPPTQRLKMSLSELNRRALTPEVDSTPIGNKGYGLSYATEGSPAPGKDLAHLSDLVDENMDTLRETAKRRKQVAGSLKKALIERGVKTTRVN